MNTCEYNLGSILRAAEELSRTEQPCPSLKHIQIKTGLTTDQLVAALEFEPNPLGWQLKNLDPETAAEPTFMVRGRPYTRLMINRFASA